jgi:hypothetical protein
MEKSRDYTFDEFFLKWEKFVNAPYNSVSTVVEMNQELWKQLRILKDPHKLNTINLSIVPIVNRWFLAERFPELSKKLLIDTTSYDINRIDGIQFVHGQNKIYLFKYLINQINTSGNPEFKDIVKSLIRKHFDYPIR